MARATPHASGMSAHHTTGLSGLTVALFESRYGTEFARLVAKQGGRCLAAPAIVEAELAFGVELEAFVSALGRSDLDGLVVLTGQGQRKLVGLLAPLMSRDELGERLRGILVAARGPKAVGALKELGVRPQVVAPAPHTWHDLLAALEASVDLRGKRLALQQYGVPHTLLTQALEARGAVVSQLPVYRWQLPEDVTPMLAIIARILSDEVDAVLFTAGPQAGSLFEVAERSGQGDALRAALGRTAVGSIGPICSEALRNLDITPDFEPEHGKMGQLVLLAARQVAAVRAAKRR